MAESQNRKGPLVGVSEAEQRKADNTFDDSAEDPSVEISVESIIREDNSLMLGEIRTCNPPVDGNKDDNHPDYPDREVKTYKRRWIGVAQISLLNIIMSWNWLTFAPVASASVSYYSTTYDTINWLTIVVSFAFTAASPLVLWVLHLGPRPAIIVAAILTVAGNWLRYGGSSSGSGGTLWLVMLGQILIGVAQPFALTPPTTYSNMWFTSNGRVAATAIMTLSNPLGGALGQLVLPLWVEQPSDMSHGILYISIISSIFAVAAIFLPSAPPTPVSTSATTPRPDFLPSLRAVGKSLEMFLLVIPFAVYVGLFTTISSLLSQSLGPYGFSDTEAGIGGAILIVAGAVAAIISAPILDRTKAFLVAIKAIFPICGICYLVYVWLPEERNVVAIYIVLGVLGASSFSLMPVTLEFLVDLSHPAGLEITSVIAWSAGQLLSGCFILICGAMQAGETADPPNNMKNALTFQAVIGMIVVPLPICLGLFGRSDRVTLTRIHTNQH